MRIRRRGSFEEGRHPRARRYAQVTILQSLEPLRSLATEEGSCFWMEHFVVVQFLKF